MKNSWHLFRLIESSYVASFNMKRNSELIPFNSESKNIKINKTESKFVITMHPAGGVVIVFIFVVACFYGAEYSHLLIIYHQSIGKFMSSNEAHHQKTYRKE
jgi:hypothetical protein